MEWFSSMTTPDHTRCKHDKSGYSGTRLGDSSTSALLSGPCPIGLPPLPLSLQQSALGFLQQRRWAPKLARRVVHNQTGGFLQAWDRKPARKLRGSRE
jgi:hypothetical protein